MSKQDGYSSRTAVDLERKYNFGKTFAEVYNLVSDAQRAAQEAQKAYDNLTQDEVFNLLTDFGKSQGVYRGEDDNVYINASYIKSGKLAAEYIDATNLKVAAANVTGQLVATQIDAKDLKVLAANVTGTLTAGQIDTTNLQVSAANVTGKLTAAQIDATNLSVAAANVTGMLTASQIDTTNLSVAAANISGRLTFNKLPTDVATTEDISEYAASAAETYVDEWCVSSPTIKGGVFYDTSSIGRLDLAYSSSFPMLTYSGYYGEEEDVKKRSESDYVHFFRVTPINYDGSWVALQMLDHLIFTVDDDGTITPGQGWNFSNVTATAKFG